MADLMHKHTYFKFNQLPDPTIKTVNFIAGFLLLAFTLFFMFSREVFMRPGYQVDGIILFLSGTLSITASMSDKVKTVFWLNMISGLLLLLGSFGIIMFYGHTGEDLMVHALLGLVFLYNALSCKKSY